MTRATRGVHTSYIKKIALVSSTFIRTLNKIKFHSNCKRFDGDFVSICGAHVSFPKIKPTHIIGFLYCICQLFPLHHQFIITGNGDQAYASDSV